MSEPSQSGGGARRPRAAFALSPARTRYVFADSDRAKLQEMCDIPDPAPLETFDDARAAALLAETEALITGWGCAPIEASFLDKAPKLRLIAHAAGTVKTFIAPEILARGVLVTQAGAANALPVAEFTLAAILFANKAVFRFRDQYAQSRGARQAMTIADEPIGNYRKIIGIIGASRIGRRVIELLKPFDFDILLHDPFVSAADATAMGATLLELDDLLRASDVVSLHAPSTPATRHMLDARRLSLIRNGATFINTARGALVDHAAMEAELASGRFNAFIDVTEPEVLPPESPLYSLPNVVLTPHIAGALGVERERLGALIADEIRRYISGEPLQHAVDLALLDRLA
ncbi:hydroxyacid dehydrogenase [Terrarubrum flagellatum]|uniref:hydroxyacid dehydrogenase n=1 Tax=Terrirubrum flagellatum TaxID=2895980 RepID=UPI0031450677